MSHNDTIVAQATSPGRSSIGILRVSGNQASEVARKVLGQLPQARYANYLLFFDEHGCTLDQGIALWFPAPHSFTGEDVLELQGHGSPVVLDLLLRSILLVPGLRIAKPGEFSERAFLHEKIDLTQAEAIADLIDASSEKAARAAACSLQGAFSIHVKTLVEKLTNLRIYIEAMLDFPDDEIDYTFDNNIEVQLNQVMSNLDAVKNAAQLGSSLREGRKVVIAGKSNAGKSSLFNRLCGRKSAIVTDLEGTTRDILHERIYIDGMLVHIIDTAGLRKTNDKIENIGMELACQEIQKADHVFFVLDGTTTKSTNLFEIFPDFVNQLGEIPPFTIIRNKSDITKEIQGSIKSTESPVFCLSARTGEGIEYLMKHLSLIVSNDEGGVESGFLARRRHIQALELAAVYLKDCKHYLSLEYDRGLFAENLRLAQQALSEITGTFSSDELLDGIFSSFCIGK
ncbi:tRNA uridine-5-carboxymethylaminomethyl(34) synthesis GTPase MnmE [Candidatus Erwinia haradaeae]|uniref:tRNA modification GTPase MnmE n=1 Tax=Candidatus Erwinia haradaeae TaxID=1922217 RepID=A0A451D350_9GAMM|nr:tRNA uridine-5-carboxymethylaminomethyl(34) synthesis GTPase MnmE [Candidatus Erwinia haradaeae]VFP80090.1 tRNA modification GTPase MnmE [Candidatus Erwinia haradaeae]